MNDLMQAPAAKPLLIALAVSITLNLVGAGWALGRLHGSATDRPGGQQRWEFISNADQEFTYIATDGEEVVVPVVIPDIPHQLSGGLEWIVSSLPPERRDPIALEIEIQQQPLLAEAEQIMSLRGEVRTELARTEFERARLERALERLREHLVMTQADAHRILADVAEELTEEERAALASSMVSSVLAPEAAVAPMPPRIEVYRHRFITEHAGEEGDVRIEIHRDARESPSSNPPTPPGAP